MSKTIVVPGSTVPLYEHTDSFYRPYPQASAGLYDPDVTAPVVIGHFLLDPNTAGEDDMFYIGRQCISKGTATGRIFVQGTETNGRQSVGEFNIPALVNTTNRAAMNVGTNRQGFKRLHTQFTNMSADFKLAAISYDAVSHPLDPSYVGTGQLHLGGHSYYSNTLDAYNSALLRNAAALSTFTRYGMFQISGAARSAGRAVKLPASWRSSFGGASHLMCGGVGYWPIISRMAVGPTAWPVNFDDMQVSDTPTLISTTPAMDFPFGPGTQLSDDLQSQLWNHLSAIAGAFILPNTNTLMCIGSNLDRRAPYNNPPGGLFICYGASQPSDNGDTSQAYRAYYHQAYANYYWLFDLQDLADSFGNPSLNPPHMIRPYKHGYWNHSTMRSAYYHRIGGAYYDYEQNLLVTSVDYGADSRFGASAPGYEVYDLGTR